MQTMGDKLKKTNKKEFDISKLFWPPLGENQTKTEQNAFNIMMNASKVLKKTNKTKFDISKVFQPPLGMNKTKNEQNAFDIMMKASKVLWPRRETLMISIKVSCQISRRYL